MPAIRLPTYGWPRMRGSWKPWHDGLDLVPAMRAAMEFRKPGSSAAWPVEELNRCGERCAPYVVAVLERYDRVAMVESIMLDLHAELLREAQRLYTVGLMPIELSPVFDFTEDRMIHVKWRDAYREQLALEGFI